jgi:hypothetical protein
MAHRRLGQIDSKTSEQMRSFAIGMAASFGDVLLSGFVSIYFEMVLKSKTETFSVWDRNLQLAFWSMLIYAPIMLYDRPNDPFGGWSVITLLCAACGALGEIGFRTQGGELLGQGGCNQLIHGNALLLSIGTGVAVQGFRQADAHRGHG